MKQRWNEDQFDEVPYPGPEKHRSGRLIVLHTGRKSGKQLNITGFMQSNLYLPPSFLPPNAGFGGIEMNAESMTKSLQKISNLMSAMDDEPYAEGKPPHSMSPPGGRIYDRRGRQKY